MIIVLFDKSEIVVDRATGEKVVNAIGRSTDGIIKLKGYPALKKSAIAYVKEGGQSEAEVIAPGRRIDAGKPKRRASASTVSSIREELEKKGIVKRKVEA